MATLTFGAGFELLLAAFMGLVTSLAFTFLMAFIIAEVERRADGTSQNKQD